MATFLTCEECGQDYLVPDEHGTGGPFAPDPDDENVTACCQRCFDLCYRATELEKQKREAYRIARTAE